MFLDLLPAGQGLPVFVHGGGLGGGQRGLGGLLDAVQHVGPEYIEHLAVLLTLAVDILTHRDRGWTDNIV